MEKKKSLKHVCRQGLQRWEKIYEREALAV